MKDNIKYNPLISIIIPVYNVEPYLERCVQSVINQDYTNFELFLIDDGSTDNSGAICDSYAKKDSRVNVIHQKNAGQSAARNAAIRLAKGEYFTFIDSDDFVDKDYISFLLNLLISNNADLSVCSVRHIGFPNQKDSEITNDKPYICSTDAIAYNILLGSNGFSASASHMLINANICRENFFIEGVIFEDLAYMIKLSFEENIAVTSKERKYNYCYRDNNSSSTPTAKRKHDLEVIMNQIRELIHDKDPRLLIALENRYISNSLYLLKSLHKGEHKLFPVIRRNILSCNIDKSMQSKSAFMLFKALKFGRIPFYIFNFLYNRYKQLQQLLKGE